VSIRAIASGKADADGVGATLHHMGGDQIIDRRKEPAIDPGHGLGHCIDAE